jgi:3-oxoacyl-[acyl-carrier protein] reductase
MQRNVLITGASRGIGKAIAIHLAKDNWTPLIHYRVQETDAKEVARQTNGICAPFGTDLSSVGGCEKLWEWAESIGTLHALVNNAGIYHPVSFDCDSDEEFEENWESTFETNLFSAVRLTRFFVTHVKNNSVEMPKILNICSRVGFRGEPGASAYAASKSAQINLTRSLAVELAPLGIRVFGIAPGWVETAMTRHGMETRRKAIEASIPLGRVATVDDIGAVARFLMNDESEYLSGVVIDVNGASYFH